MLFWKRTLICLVIIAVILTIAMPANAAELTETELQENPYLIEYEGNKFIVPDLSLNREPEESAAGYVEKYTEPPQYFQSYYPYTRYGDSNIRKSGCGITCISMVLTYLLDKEVTVEELAQKYSNYKVKGGSSYTLFPDTAEDYGVIIEKQVWNWQEAKEALQNGQVIIANAHSQSIFTDGGHFIVLSGITEDEKIVVRDPNLYNYSIYNYPAREEGYAKGFDEKYLKYDCFPMWIYAPKDIDAIALRVQEENYAARQSETLAETEPVLQDNNVIK